MGVRDAELTKYAANAMLATRISFMNEMARLCDALGADIESVRRGIGSDTRIGYSYLYAGCGYGGSCFPKDVRALIDMARQAKVEPNILAAVARTNEAQKQWASEVIADRYGHRLQGRRFGVWGLSFKPNTDDLREAPAITIIGDLLAAGAQVGLVLQAGHVIGRLSLHLAPPPQQHHRRDAGKRHDRDQHRQHHHQHHLLAAQIRSVVGRLHNKK